MQNFKMSVSEYLRCAPKYTISRLNNQKFLGRGHSPLPRPLSRRGGGHPSPHPTPRHLRRLASRAFGDRPPTQKSWLRPCAKVQYNGMGGKGGKGMRGEGTGREGRGRAGEGREGTGKGRAGEGRGRSTSASSF